MKELSTHKVIKFAYAAWSLLFLVETLVSLSSYDAAIASLGDLGGLGPDPSLGDLSTLVSGGSVVMALVVIGSGWPLVLWLPENRSSVFLIFVSSCVLSILDSAWTMLSPGGDTTIFTRLLNLGYLILSGVMLKFAYRLRDEVRASR